MLLDEKTLEPIEFANVFFAKHGVGVSTNQLGEFDLVVPKKAKQNDSVSISCIGYVTKMLSLAELQGLKEVHLSEKVIQLEELTVLNGPLTTEDIVRISIGKISKNYNSKPYQLQTFYRHYCSENGIYGRLIEAAVTVFDSKGHKSLVKGPESKLELKVEQIRRSFDYTKNFDEHDAISINSTIKYDVSSYETLLHGYPDNWSFKVVDTTFYNGSYVWVIGYNYAFIKNKGGSSFKINATGKMYVNVADFGIVRVEEKQVNELNKEYENHSYLLEWEVNYQKYLGKYYLSYVKESGWNIDEKLGNNKEVVSVKDHRFHVEMMVNGIVLNGYEKFKGKEPTTEEIKEIKYDESFWDDYGVLKNTPLNNRVVEDLEREKSLQDQYNE